MRTEDMRLTEKTEPSQTYSWGTFFRDPDPHIGTHAFTDEAAVKLSTDEAQIPKIIAGIIEARSRGEKRSIVVFDQHAPDLEERHNRMISIDELLRSYPRSADEMIDRVLMNASQLHPKPGEKIRFTDAKVCLLYGNDRQECQWMLRQLESLGYISINDDALYSALASFTIESAGWKYIGELRRKPSSSSPQAFVAMHFHDDMKSVYEEGIRPAIEADGKTKCVRIDGVQHNNKICDEIIAAIRKSRYVVADFTGNRGGVYYEAGFAHGLGIPVIWTVKGSTDGLHFDTRQYNHIVYQTPAELQKMLRDRIAATIPT